MITAERNIARQRLRRVLVSVALVCAFLAVGGTVGFHRLWGSIRIGYVGPMVGRSADLGTSGRDGVMLAVEEWNARGGVNGRRIEILVGDDKQDPEEAMRVDRELIDAGVVAIIGHMTSSMSVAAVDVCNEAEVLMFSPTTSTKELSGRDDWFFRIYPTTEEQAQVMADHVFGAMGDRNVAPICDVGNKSFVDSWREDFRERFEQLGGRVLESVEYVSGPDVVFSNIVAKAQALEPDCVLLITGAEDTAMLCQRWRALDTGTPLVGSEWSGTGDLVAYGGRTVEGFTYAQTFGRDADDSEFNRFRLAFSTRFGCEPGYAAIHAYDAAGALLHALETNPDGHALRESLLAERHFEGVKGQVVLDEFGDAKGEPCLMMIRDGASVRVD